MVRSRPPNFVRRRRSSITPSRNWKTFRSGAIDGSSTSSGERPLLRPAPPPREIRPRSPPSRERHPGALRGAEPRRVGALEQHPRGAARGGREVQGSRPVVRDRAGVHTLRRESPHGLAGSWLPRAPGRLLLRRRERRGVRPRDRGGPRRRLHPRGDPHRRDERRGDARAVGVPDRRRRRAGHRRRDVARALAAVPHRRGVRGQRDAVPEAGEGRLERRRRAHQFLDEAHARSRAA